MNYLKVWFNFHVFDDFLVVFLLLVSNLIPLQSDNIFCIVSVFEMYLNLFNDPESLSVKVPGALDENMYPAV